MLAIELRMEWIEIVEPIKIRGNIPCLTCSFGNICDLSGVPALFELKTMALADKCIKVEDQWDIWRKIQRLGKALH